VYYAFIPARGGSTRLKDKNYLNFKGKVLFEWSIIAAEKSTYIDKIIFSSDSEKYIQHTNSLNLTKELLIDKRTSDNSSAKTRIYDYLKKDFIKNNKFLLDDDYIVMLLPTQPFRSVDEIDNVIKFAETIKKNVFTCREFDFPISFAFTFSENSIIKTAFDQSPLETGNTQSQDQENYFHPDGSVYVLSVKTLKQNLESIYKNSTPFVSTIPFFIDINNQNDFNKASKINIDVVI